LGSSHVCRRGRQLGEPVQEGLWERTYTREGTVVPEVAFVREAVADEAKLAFLDVLFDGIEEFVFGDLGESQSELQSF